jgi:uncharacterized membrane protein (Fun14 family)
VDGNRIGVIALYRAQMLKLRESIANISVPFSVEVDPIDTTTVNDNDKHNDPSTPNNGDDCDTKSIPQPRQRPKMSAAAIAAEEALTSMDRVDDDTTSGDGNGPRQRRWGYAAGTSVQVSTVDAFQVGAFAISYLHLAHFNVVIINRAVRKISCYYHVVAQQHKQHRVLLTHLIGNCIAFIILCCTIILLTTI